jgi:low temperature requirement protein LtrA
MGEPTATSSAARLLRKPEQPERATFLDLFFDLVFVLALTRVSLRLFDDVTAQRRMVVTEAGQTLLLLLALLMVWFAMAWITDLYDPRAPAIQLLVIAAMFGVLVMAVALPDAFDTRALAFACAYVAIHLVRGLVLVPALRGHEAQRRAAAVLSWFAVSAVLWIGGALEAPARGVLWTLALAIEYTGAVLLFPAPWVRRAPPRWPVAAEYMAERYQQFFIIALGELILLTGVTYSAEPFATGGATAGFVVAFATTALLWRTYIFRAGELLPAAFAAAPEPVRLVRRALFAHVLMVVGVVIVAVGYEVVITRPWGRSDAAWVGVIFGGPILFLAGRVLFEHAVFGRVSRSRPIGGLMLASASPVMILLPPLAVGIIAAAVLAGIVGYDARRAKRSAPEAPRHPA